MACTLPPLCTHSLSLGLYLSLPISAVSIQAQDPINKMSLHVVLPHPSCMRTLVDMHVHERVQRSSLLIQQVVCRHYWKHIFLSLTHVYTHNADTAGRVLRALLTPNLLCKWDNNRMMWREEGIRVTHPLC